MHLVNPYTDSLFVGTEKYNLLIPETEILAKVKEIGQKISSDYKDKVPVFIGILNGAVLFIADLIRNVNLNCEIDFLRLSSYGDEKLSSGRVKALTELNSDINGKDVIIVEDIVDTGSSINFIMELILKTYKPASMRFASLLVKPGSLKYDAKIDYIGFNIPSKFVIGYGLDAGQKYRNLRAIYILDESGV